MPRVLLVGYYGKMNYGDDVLLTVTYNIIRRAMPDAEISVIIGDSGGEYVQSMLPGVTTLRPARHGHFDVIVHGGGGVFFDFANHSAKHKLQERLYQLLGMRRVMCLEKFIRRITNKQRTSATRRIGIGIGVGTFSAGSPKLWQHSLPILSDFDALWVRDAQSIENLKRFAPAMTAKQIQGSDLAFLTEYWLKPLAPRPPAGKPKLGIALRDLRGLDAETLRTLFAKLATRYDITGFILDESEDLRTREALAPYQTCIWQPQHMSVQEFAARLGEQDVLLTSRAHGAICGACVGVPPVIVNIEPKLAQVHSMLQNSSVLVPADNTAGWEAALEKARAISVSAIAEDVQRNREASEKALKEIIAPRPRVLLLATQLGYGGAETSFIRLANYLSQSMDVTVALFTKDYGAGAYAQGHEILLAQTVLLDTDPRAGKIKRWWQRLLKLREMKRTHDVCISFLSGPNTLNTLAGYNRKTVISLRGPRMHNPNTPTWNRRIFQYFLDPITLNLAARIVPVSSGLCNEMRLLGGPWNVKKARVISPFIIAEKHFVRAQEAVPEIYQPLKNQPLIVCAGRVSVEKNFQYLIPIFAKVAKKHTGAKLLIVGDGPMMDDLRKLCHQSGLPIDNMAPGTASVIFAGYQKNPLSFIALGKVFALPSGTEGVPNVLLEAITTGTPAVAADAAWAARSVLAPGDLYRKPPYPTQRATPAEYGILMPRIDEARYADEWVRMLGECLESDKWRQAYGEKAKQRARDYDMPNVAIKWKTLIEEMMGA